MIRNTNDGRTVFYRCPVCSKPLGIVEMCPRCQKYGELVV